MFPLFTLLVDPFGLAEAGSPYAVSYVYVFWPKLVVVTCTVALALSGGLLLRVPPPPHAVRMLLLTLLAFMLLLGGTHWLARNTLPTPDELWMGAVERADGLLWQGLWLSLLPLFAWIMPTLFQSQKALRALHLFWGMAVVGTFLWTALQTAGIEPTRWVYSGFQTSMPAAGLGHQAQTGFIASVAWVVTLILVTERQVGRLGYFCLICGAATTSLSMGRTGIITGLLGTGLYGLMLILRRVNWWEKKRYLFSCVLIFMSLVAATLLSNTIDRADTIRQAASGQDASFNHRLLLWKAGVQVVKEYPLLGQHSTTVNDMIWPRLNKGEVRELLTEYGDRQAILTGHYSFKNNVLAIEKDRGKSSVQMVDWDKFHNNYLEIATRSGLITLILYLTFILILFLRLWTDTSVYSRTGAIVLLMFSTYGLVWFSTPTADPLIFALLGLSLAATAQDHKKFVAKL